MKKNILVILRELFVTQLNHFNIYLALFPITIAVSGNAEFEGLNPFIWSVVGLVPWGLYFVRKHVKRGFALLLCYASAVGFVSLLPKEHFGFGIIYVICTVVYCMRSSFISSASSNINNIQASVIMPPVTVGISFLCQGLLTYLGYYKWTTYYAVFTMAILCGYFIVYFMDHYIRFLAVNEGSTGYIPKKEILLSGLKLIGGYLCIGLVFLVATVNVTWVEHILNPLKKMLVAGLGWVLSLLPEEKAKQVMEQSPAETEGMLTVETTGESWLWSFLDKVLVVVLLLLAVYLIWKILSAVLGFLRGRLKTHNMEADSRTEKVYDVREKCDKIHVGKEKPKGILGAFSHEERIRRYFKKKVKASKYLITNQGDDATLARYTAKECAKALEKPALAQIYEKARYSDVPCEKKDVVAMKAACK